MVFGDQFSLVRLVLIAAAGLIIFSLLFIFAQRQIMRFALKSARKPHVSIGSNAPKILRDKINRCLEMTQSICFEPTLLSEEVQNAANSTENHYYYRMKALDAFSNAVNTLQWSDSSVPRRKPKQTIQLYLYCLCPSAAGSKGATTIEKFARCYTLVRHSPAIFGEAEFVQYMEILDKVIRLIKLDQKRRSKSIRAVDMEVYCRSSGTGALHTVAYTALNSTAEGEEEEGENIPLQDTALTRNRGKKLGSVEPKNGDPLGSAERLIETQVKRV